MIEVTRNNFSYLLPQIASAIEAADFVSVDTEFTGLFLDDECKASLFDTNADRYQKIKKSVEAFTVAQIGLTAFIGDTNRNRYHATSFSFYLCPVAFSSVDPRFSLQSSCVQFLSAHNFDFNKCFKEGLSYLNCDQETQIMEDLTGGFLHAGDDEFVDERELQSLCSHVASWLCHSKPGDFLTVSLKESGLTSLYIVQNEIRSRFLNAWTSVNDFNQIVVENITREKRMCLGKGVQEWEQIQHQQVLNDLLGFTRVFRILQKEKKPLVGHNLLTDLLFIFSKFHQRLPDTYEEFKKKIHALFPIIFDTKHLNHYLKERFKSLNLKGAYNLEILDQILNSQTAIRLTRMQPAIEKPIIQNSPNGFGGYAPHHAGYDSFLCGCAPTHTVVLASATRDKEADIICESESITFQSYLSSVGEHSNSINVIRASTPYTKLDGDDPSCQRPPLLHVSYNGPDRKISSQQLAAEFAFCGTVDIKMISATQGIVATSHFMVARDILSSFKNHATICVTRFRFLLHSRLGKFITWSTLGIVSGLYVSLLIKILK